MITTKQKSPIEVFNILIEQLENNKLPLDFIQYISKDFIEKLSNDKNLKKSIKLTLKTIKVQYEYYSENYGENAEILTKTFIKNFF